MIGKTNKYTKKREKPMLSIKQRKKKPETKTIQEKSMRNIATIYNLSSPLDPLPDAEVADDPGNPQGDHQFSLQAARLIHLFEFAFQNTKYIIS